MKKGVLICYHGTKDLNGFNDTKKLTKFFKSNNKNVFVSSGYLENSKPSIKDQFKILLKRKVKIVDVIPAMIFSGGHVLKDIPRIILNEKKKYNLKIKTNFYPPLIKSKKLYTIIQNSINTVLKLIKKGTPKSLVIIASNTISYRAKLEINFLTKKISKLNNIKSSKNILIGLDKNFLKNELLKFKNNKFGSVIILPIFLFRGRLLNNCIEVTQNLNLYFNSKKYFLASHIKNYKKIARFLKK